MDFKTLFAAVATAALTSTAALAQDMGDADAGQKVFNKCKACHVVDDVKNRVGPHLQGVIGRTPGAVEGFKYSDAMIAYGNDHVWDEETLGAYLKAPRDVVKGTKMAFPGLKKDEDVANVIAYIKQAGG
jgi:cytochrome c